MSRRRNLLFDPLEARELLSRMHHPLTHVHRGRPAVAMVQKPLSLSGTLTVENQASVSNSNQLGGTSTSIPIRGQLAGIGPVHGLWLENSDSLGNYVGPDTITIRAPHGAFTIAFSNASPGPVHRTGKMVYYQHDQHVISSSGTFAHSSETGTIDLNLSPSQATVASLTLNG